MKFPKHDCGLYLEHNKYKDYYEPIDKAVESESGDWISYEEQQKATETGEIWTLQWYPDTPIGFCRMAASSLNALLEAANNSAV